MLLHSCDLNWSNKPLRNLERIHNFLWLNLFYSIGHCSIIKTECNRPESFIVNFLQGPSTSIKPSLFGPLNRYGLSGRESSGQLSVYGSPWTWGEGPEEAGAAEEGGGREEERDWGEARGWETSSRENDRTTEKEILLEDEDGSSSSSWSHQTSLLIVPKKLARFCCWKTN